MSQSAHYIINEWLWSDLSGENGDARQVESFRFLEALQRGPDRIVIVVGSSFDKKSWQLCTFTDVRRRLIARFFVGAIRFDSRKCRLLHYGELPAVPGELVAATKPDDHYLIQAVMSVPGSVLVTEDQPLKEALDRGQIACLLRDPFVSHYIKRS